MTADTQLPACLPIPRVLPAAGYVAMGVRVKALSVSSRSLMCKLKAHNIGCS